MNIATDFLAQVQGLPGGGWIVNTINAMVASIGAAWDKEHKDDGTHGNVTVDSLTVQGAKVGDLSDVAYDGSIFFANGSAVWTVQSTDVRYLKTSRIGQLVFVQFRLEGTALATDTSDALYISLRDFHALPYLGSSGFGTTEIYGGGLQWQDVANSKSGVGQVAAVAQPFGTRPYTLLQLDRVSPTNATFDNWAISSNLDVYGWCWFMCQPDNVVNANVPT